MREEAFAKDDNLIKLETTSKYNPLLNTDIRFFTSDVGTAVLNFLVTKNDKPFEVGPSNADASIVLETENYGTETGAYISDDLTFADPINGRFSYVLPERLLKYDGKVYGQVYFRQNGNGNIIVERKFSFTISNDLISDFDGETKLIYIKTLKDMTDNLQQDVLKIKKSLGEAATIVGNIEQKTSEGLLRIETKTNEHIQFITIEQSRIEKEFKEKTDGFLQSVDIKKTELNQELNRVEKKISDSDLVKVGDTVEYQKSKLTTDEGLAIEVTNESLRSILERTQTTKLMHVSNATDAPSFHAETPNVEQNVPSDVTEIAGHEITINDNYIDSKVTEGSSTTSSGFLAIYRSENNGHATWKPDDTNEIYTCFYKNGLWFDWYKINDEGITRRYIEGLFATAKGTSIEYTDSKLEALNWQKHRLSESNGESIKVDLNYAQSNLINLLSGNYYGINIPDLPSNMTVTEGFIRVTVKNAISKLFEYTPIGTHDTYVRVLNNSNLSSWNAANGIKKNVLFEGSANGVGTDIALTDDYTKYDILFITGVYPGGQINEFTLTSMTTSIILSKNNIVDADGNGGGAYEAIISKVNGRTLKITNDVFYDLGLQKASGANANKITVNKIVGIR
ncbi:phage baseplate upper protein [Staphylococcus equorum]|uniref:phage baseplate upper protein n=1 Tax=Staphylococcus equorum TaxID=246432 RepID=UPI003D807B30